MQHYDFGTRPLAIDVAPDERISSETARYFEALAAHQRALDAVDYARQAQSRADALQLHSRTVLGLLG